MMNFNLKNYDIIVFDCDGVILNSNSVKTNAFYETALPYGEVAARMLMEHHTLNGGISRYEKFNFFLESILPKHSKPGHTPTLDELLKSYAAIIRKGLLSCDIADGLFHLKHATKGSKWMVASGGDQNEIRRVFSERKLTSLFDYGIFGSPDNKYQILDREIPSQASVLFFGDSKYDYEVSKAKDFDFIFISDWTEVSDWSSWTKKNNIKTANDLRSFL
tara:strand:+ start:5235 stop:5891 length:657 start_codon:yes stop_codon:yes gene_type:complete